MAEQSQKQNILIVDDEPGNIKVLTELLSSKFTIRAATNGEKALKIVGSDKPPDLILLDVMMPGIDGYAVCQRLKADPTTRNIPVIFITSKDSEEDQVKGFKAGAVDYIMKPFSPVVVEARVQTHVELKIQRELLKELSFRDGLTGIANRRRFDDYLKTVWNFAGREASPTSLILIDLDHFKSYNDNYGHQAGDTCLIRVAQAMEASLPRKVDLIARYGGEEFGCILPKTDLDAAFLIAERFRDSILALQMPHAVSSACSCVSISQGVASTIPSKDASPDDLLKMADQALYQAKQTGRNRCCSC
ncbi:MAG: PleD family two-component system response regulator [Deltaproteobacteria bacterium]|nr:PleD family two-component system response regulator [Deltaproteobacteria bacterium]MBF0523989.1 PleD family two-component system response regulator [Deltaproteobacteria bacterium]